MVALADAALYAAKRGGRNRWVGVLGVDESLDASALQGLTRVPAASWQDGGPLHVVRS